MSETAEYKQIVHFWELTFIVQFAGKLAVTLV